MFDDNKVIKTRAHDLSFTGNILDCLKKYHHLSLTSDKYIKLNEIDGIILIGSDSMMSGIQIQILIRIFLLTVIIVLPHQLTNAMHDERDLWSVPTRHFDPKQN